LLPHNRRRRRILIILVRSTVAFYFVIANQASSKAHKQIINQSFRFNEISPQEQ
jgi:hypothetical protein